MDKRQREILEHALGFGREKFEYRNYFVAGGDDERVCRELVTLGYMREGRKMGELTDNAPLFHVTDAGRVAIGVSPKDGETK